MPLFKNRSSPIWHSFAYLGLRRSRLCRYAKLPRLHKWQKCWFKVEGCCRQALWDGLEYVWIDCYCIDKSSSAELKEAINFMFMWYKMSQVYYTYLSDITEGDGPVSEGSSFRRARLKRNPRASPPADHFLVLVFPSTDRSVPGLPMLASLPISPRLCPLIG